MAAIEELERRVTALESAQNDTTQTLRWAVAKLGRISSVQDEHTLRLERIDGDVKRIETDLRSLRTDLPGIVTDAVRDGIKAASDA